MTAKRRAQRLKPKSLPALTRSDDLCKHLVALAAFSLIDQPKAQEKIYAAVRQLQRLDIVATEAGILPPR